MRQKEVNYTARVVSIFGAAGLFLALFFMQPQYLANDATKLVVYLSMIVAVLAFAYFLLKLFFYVNAHNEQDELHLRELPKDQDDIAHEH